MTHTRYAIAAYRSAVMTTPPLPAVVLLYDGILVRIEAAAKAAAVGDFGRQFDDVMRAIDILQGLLASLDMAKGGDVAIRLRDTYVTNIRALMRSVARPGGAEACHRIAAGLRRLRNAWAEIGGLPPLAIPPPPARIPPAGQAPS